MHELQSLALLKVILPCHLENKYQYLTHPQIRASLSLTHTNAIVSPMPTKTPTPFTYAHTNANVLYTRPKNSNIESTCMKTQMTTHMCPHKSTPLLKQEQNGCKELCFRKLHTEKD